MIVYISNRLSYLFLVFLFVTTKLYVTIFSHSALYWDYFVTLFDKDFEDTYDFIIVGAGSAGSVVAHRLSKHNKVLLLEAGGEPTLLNSIPGFGYGILNHPGTDWMHETVPQKHGGAGSKNNKILWPRGKLLGGSSSINFMFYLRGHPMDYENWANIAGDPGWNYDNLLPFFKKSLYHYEGKFSEDYETSPYGFLHLEDQSYVPLQKEFFDGSREMGLTEIDVNKPYSSGFGAMKVNTKQGKRWGLYAALLQRPAHTSNLRISKYSLAQKIKLTKNHTEGVWFTRHGVRYFARATKEVILSAGTIESTKLLLLSGIGPKEHLENLNIRVKTNLPVGENLQDHPLAAVIPFLIDKPLSFLPERDLKWKSVWEYATKGTGIFSSVAGITAQIFINSSFVSKSNLNWPDIQLYVQATGPFLMTPELSERAQGFRPEFMEAILSPYYGTDGFYVPICLMRAKSRGTIRLRNTDVGTPPLIDPNYLSRKEDMVMFMDGLKFVLNMIENTTAFKSINARLSTKSIPGCENLKFRSIKYWKCHFRHFVTTEWHPVGTCRMGKVNDPKSVVDTKLRVLKVTGLRVIDASIMPEIVSVNTNGATIMIGEKGSDFIRDYWTTQTSVCDLVDWIRLRDKDKCYYSRWF